MNIGRSTCQAAVLDNTIYVIGGFDGSKTTTSVECYDPSTDTWSHRADLPSARSGMSVLNCDIYTGKFTWHGKNMPAKVEEEIIDQVVTVLGNET